MPTLTTLDILETGELIINADDKRAAADPFKLPPFLRTLAETRLAALKATHAAAKFAAGDRAGASLRVQEAADKLRTALRAGHKAIGSIMPEDLPEADRQAALRTYGWERGLIGSLEQTARVEELANLAITGDSLVAPAARYPAAVLSRIITWLAVLNANQPLAATGDRAAAIAARNTARKALFDCNGRVRNYYGCASDDKEKTKELAKIGMQPKRDPGDAQPQPLPEPVTGELIHDPAAQTVTAPNGLPAHATSIIAKIKPDGGEWVVAGFSLTPTVSLLGNGPLTADVEYTVVMAGKNSRGLGVESEPFSFTA